MEEIEDGVYIEQGYAGVTLGALAYDQGTILIDAPPCPEDTRSWRAALRNLGSGVTRLLINLDQHYDRTLGARAMGCPVMAHTLTAESFQQRSAVFKGQPIDSGADWEECIGLSGVRWAPPTLTLDQRSNLYWAEEPLILEHHPGPTPGAIWAILPERRVVFVGDTVVSEQVPFLENADLPAWIEALDLLISKNYRNHLIVSGRGGPVALDTLRAQRRALKYVQKRMETLAGREAPPEEALSAIKKLMSDLEFPASREEQYRQRLAYGLRQFYIRNYWTGELQDEE